MKRAFIYQVVIFALLIGQIPAEGQFFQELPPANVKLRNKAILTHVNRVVIT